MAPPRGSFAPRGSFRPRGGSFSPRGSFAPRGSFGHGGGGGRGDFSPRSFQPRGDNFNSSFDRKSGPPPPKRHNEFNLQEEFPIEDIKGGKITDRLTKILDCLAATAPEDKPGVISLRVSAMYIPKAAKQPQGEPKAKKEKKS